MDVSPVNLTAPVILSPPAAVEAVKKLDTENRQDTAHDPEEGSESANQGSPASAKQKDSPLQAKSIQQLSQEEQAEVQQLQQRDRDVRSHEAAHKSAAGRFAQGGASFEYQRGPDGQQYAVGGEVSIDTSRPEDPRQALIKAQIIQRAATAPAQPSAQDRAVAAEAATMIAEAQVAIQQERQTKSEAVSEEAEQSGENVQGQGAEGGSAQVLAYQAIQQDPASEQINLIV